MFGGWVTNTKTFRTLIHLYIFYFLFTINIHFILHKKN